VFVTILFFARFENSFKVVQIHVSGSAQISPDYCQCSVQHASHKRFDHLFVTILIFTAVLVQFMTVFWNFTLCSMLRFDVSVGSTTLCKNPKNSHRATYFFSSDLYMGYRGSTLVKTLCYNSEGRRFGPSWCNWNFSLT